RKRGSVESAAVKDPRHTPLCRKTGACPRRGPPGCVPLACGPRNPDNAQKPDGQVLQRAGRRLFPRVGIRGGARATLPIRSRSLAMGQSVVVLGAQWGDEGKGKIVDLLTQDIGAVVRFQGGHNAGHTLVIGGKKTV